MTLLYPILRRGFAVAFGQRLKPDAYAGVGNEILFCRMAAALVLTFGIAGAFYLMTAQFSFYIGYNSLAICVLLVAVLPFVTMVGRLIERTDESPYLLPIIFISITIPIVLIQVLVWLWGTVIWENFGDHIGAWTQVVMFLHFILVLRAFLMNADVLTVRRLWRLILTAVLFIAVFYGIPDKSDYGPYYVSSRYDNSEYKPPRVTDEDVFGNQYLLLQKSLAAVRPSQRGQTDIYAITFGGDGSQGVFKREALFAQEKFDKVLGTAGRSLVLVNHPSTLKTLPLASLTNLTHAVEGIKGKAQADEDILVLYITSHGGPDSTITTDLHNSVFNPVDSGAIQKILKETRFRWTVVIVSACYSGSFIPVMQSDNTLIITAASAVRTSFGCSDTARLTYFGEAFLEDALPKAVSFQDAYTKTKNLISEREKAEGLTPSEPQISMGRKIRQKLEGLRFLRP